MNIAIIPARKGSKRIKDKNIMVFDGIPMLVRAVKCALEVPGIDQVYVDTDSSRFADLAIQAGARVPFLRETLCDGHSKVSQSTTHFLERIDSELGIVPQNVVQLMANCPLRTSANISEHLEHFEAHEHDFQISGFRIGYANPWWAHRLDEKGCAHPLLQQTSRNRSQDLDRVLFPTGAIWIASAAALREHVDFYGPGYTMKEMPWFNAIDIDEQDDVEFGLFAAEWIKSQIGSDASS